MEKHDAQASGHARGVHDPPHLGGDWLKGFAALGGDADCLLVHFHRECGQHDIQTSEYLT